MVGCLFGWLVVWLFAVEQWRQNFARMFPAVLVLFIFFFEKHVLRIRFWEKIGPAVVALEEPNGNLWHFLFARNELRSRRIVGREFCQ